MRYSLASDDGRRCRSVARLVLLGLAVDLPAAQIGHGCICRPGRGGLDPRWGARAPVTAERLASRGWIDPQLISTVRELELFVSLVLPAMAVQVAEGHLEPHQDQQGEGQVAQQKLAGRAARPVTAVPPQPA